MLNWFLYAAITAAIAAVVLVPVLVIFGKLCIHNGRRTALLCLFAVYLAAVYDAVGMPNAYYFRWDPVVNMVPFIDMAADAKNAALNVLMFVPLGFLLPLLSRDYRSFLPTLFFTLGTTLFLESCQLMTHRTTDINDVITNVLGAVLGYIIAKMILRRKPYLIRPAWSGVEIAVACILVLLVMFFLYPIISYPVWIRIL